MPVFTATLPVSASHPRRARHVRINFDFWITINFLKVGIKQAGSVMSTEH